MFWFLWEAKVEHGSNIRMCGGCMQTQVKQKLSDWADAGPASSIQPGEVSCSFCCSCDELSSVDTAHPLCLSCSHHMYSIMLYRNVAGSKGFGGGRRRIDNWPKLLHHAGFLLENGQNMHGLHIADARVHYQIISVLPYHRTNTTQLAKMQKSPVPRIVTAAHLHDDLQYWNLYLVPLWCGWGVGSWRGCVVLITNLTWNLLWILMCLPNWIVR